VHNPVDCAILHGGLPEAKGCYKPKSFKAKSFWEIDPGSVFNEICSSMQGGEGRSEFSRAEHRKVQFKWVAAKVE